MKRNLTKTLVSCVLTAALGIASFVPAYAFRPGDTSLDPTEREIRNSTVALELAMEGMVLFENNNDTLPIKNSGPIAVLGPGAVYTIKGGTGSGAVNNRVVYEDGEYFGVTGGQGLSSAFSPSVSVLQGFINAGYDVLTEDYMLDFLERNPRNLNSRTAILYEDELLSVPYLQELREKTDTAVYTISRQAGEGGDRTPTKGDYYLADVELANIHLLSVVFENVVVVLNTGGPMDTNWFADSGADALLNMSLAGMRGGDALVKVLNGEVSPSGKLTTTWASSYVDYPTSEFFASVNPDDPFESQIEFYSEDIYVGYRYFDTFAADKVIYPFGYGLSYTTFDIITDSVEIEGEDVVVTVTVNNTGDHAGKEVVQIYYSAPAGKLDKPYQELAAFGKTDTLEPGESQTLTISFKTANMSSYDEEQAAYIMEEGEYIIRVGNSSRNTNPEATIALDDTVITQQLLNMMAIDRQGSHPGGGTSRGTPPYPQKFDVSIEDNLDRFDMLVDEFWATNAMGITPGELGSYTGCYSDGKSTENAVKISLAGSSIENTESVYPTLAEGATIEDVNEYISATTDRIDVKGINYTSGLEYNVNRIYFDANGEAVTTEPEEMKNFRVKSGSEEDGTADYYTLLDVYNGELTMEQFVSGFTVVELANFVEGGSKSPNVAGQSAGGTSHSSRYATQEVIEDIDNRAVRGQAGMTNGLHVFDRLIPATTNADGPAGLRVDQSFPQDDTTYYQFTTAFPCGTSLAQTWNIDAVYSMGHVVGEDLAYYGVDLWLAPGMNLHRNPLCGRNFEYFSEDPVISGTIAAASTRGVQSNPGVGVTLKHFAVNNQETTRNQQNNVITERALREIYLKGFEIAVKDGQPMAIMNSYNLNNSQPADNDFDKDENILRVEWGFDGYVMTDWGASGGSSDARAMHAGTDIIMAGRNVASILGYITDLAPTILYDEDGIAIDGGFPYVTQTTNASGTTVTYTTSIHWGNYRPSADNGRDFEVVTTLEAFENETRPVRIFVDADNNWYSAQPAASMGITTTHLLQDWTIKEFLDGVIDPNGNKLSGMVDAGTAEYVVEDDMVTITYKLEKVSALDNVSTGGQEASTVLDIWGEPHEVTLTLGDLQKSVIRILNTIMEKNNFRSHVGIEATSYSETREDRMYGFSSVSKGNAE